MQEIIKAAEEFALNEIEKYGGPPLYFFNIANEKGKEIAQQLEADVEITQLGTILMDIKIGEAIENGCVKNHVQMCVDATKEFLERFDMTDEQKEKVINCVEGHHKDVPWKCKEAEICANADGYKFLLTKNWLSYLNLLAKRGVSPEKALEQAEKKAYEKWNILSLDICKQELEPQYKAIKDIVKLAKN